MDEVELKKQIEALLFSAGRTLTNEEISKLTNFKSIEIINKLAKQLKEDYIKNDSPILIIEEGSGFKMTIREKYLSLVRKINPHTEISKTIMETLAVIAWKSPILQSEVIHIRTNKAYDHITELEQLGFIIKEKYKRTYILKLTQKFFEYFDLKDKKDISKLFKNIKDFDIEEQLKVDVFDDNKENNVVKEKSNEVVDSENAITQKKDDNLNDEIKIDGQNDNVYNESLKKSDEKNLKNQNEENKGNEVFDENLSINKTESVDKNNQKHNSVKNSNNK